MATTQRKLERALHGPSVTEVTLGAGLSILLGAVLAIVYLMFKPVQTVKTLPEEPEARTVYYVEGSSSGARGGQYLRKRQLFLEGGPGDVISVTEDELNSWISSSRAGPDASAGALLAPQSVNFRIEEGVFQIGLPCSLNLFGLSRPVIVQARGGFARKGDRFVFSPDEMYVGSLAADRLPGISSLVASRLLALQDVPEEMVAAWRRLEGVAVEDDQLVLTLP